MNALQQIAQQLHVSGFRFNRSAAERPTPPPPRRKWCPDYSVPKLELGELPGTVHQEFRRCDKATCKCLIGRAEDQHGPYWVRRWREEGKQRKAVVTAVELERVRAAIIQRVERHGTNGTVRCGGTLYSV